MPTTGSIPRNGKPPVQRPAGTRLRRRPRSDRMRAVAEGPRGLLFRLLSAAVSYLSVVCSRWHGWCSGCAAGVGMAKKNAQRRSPRELTAPKGWKGPSRKLSVEELSEIGGKAGLVGGKARARVLTKEQRQAITRKAAAARWGRSKQIGRASCPHERATPGDHPQSRRGPVGQK